MAMRWERLGRREASSERRDSVWWLWLWLWLWGERVSVSTREERVWSEVEGLVMRVLEREKGRREKAAVVDVMV